MRQGLLVVEYLIDIKGLNELSYIKYDAKEGLKLGATTTHRSIEKSAVIKKTLSCSRYHGRETGLHTDP